MQFNDGCRENNEPCFYSILKVNIVEMPTESTLPHQQQGSIRKNTTELLSQEKADEVQSPILLNQMDELSTSDQQNTGETPSTSG